MKVNKQEIVKRAEIEIEHIVLTVFNALRHRQMLQHVGGVVTVLLSHLVKQSHTFDSFSFSSIFFVVT